MHRFLAVILFLLAAPALAQFDRLDAPALAPRDNAITPELVVSGDELAILMHVRPGWHGYWLNPGDAGLPMSVDWSLPSGWAVGPLRYPVPTRLLVQGIVNYVYERDYAVLATLKAPPGSAAGGKIAADLHWLACTDKVCVPEQGHVELDVPPGARARPDPRFDSWRQALPRPLASRARFERVGDRLRIGIPLPAALAIADPYFFPATDGAIAYDSPQRFRRAEDLLIAEIKAGPDQPKRIAGVLAYGAGQGLELEAEPGPVPSGGSLLGDAAATGLLAALLGAFLGGLFLNLMPCVFPILAVKALHLARAGGDERAARLEALTYAAGAVAGTAALGAVLLVLRAGGTAAGWAFQLQDPRTTLILLLLATAITLNLLKVFELPVLSGERAPAGSFGTGALAAFVATPCAGPFMGVALGAALLMPLWGSVLVFAALGLGLALPFVLIAFVPPLRRRLPRPGAWMARLQRFLAVPMAATVAAALWLLVRQAGPRALLIGGAAALATALLLALWGWAQRRERGLWQAIAAGLAGVAVAGVVLLPPSGTGSAHVPVGVTRWSPAAVAAARSSGKPVFVYFTADWCLTCKANEAAAIDRSETIAAFRDAGVKVFAGDWTNGDPAIGRFLDSRGRAGVPLYLWYAPGAAEPEELPQLLTPSMLIDRARASQKR